MGGGGGDDDVEELWNFDELDELEAQQSSSEGEEAERPPLKAQQAESEDESDEDSTSAAPAAASSSGPPAPAQEGEAAKGSEAGGLTTGGGLREKLDFLFGPGDSESEEEEDEEEEEEDDDWPEDNDTASLVPEVPVPPPKKKREKRVFEDPMKKWTPVEDDRLRGDRVPLKERVRQRLTSLAEKRLRGEAPGPPGPPPPPPEGEEATGGKKRPSVASALLGEQPVPAAPARKQTMREAQRERKGRMLDNIELREKGSPDGEPVSHECRGVRSEGLPGVPAPVLLRRAVRGAGPTRAGFARPSFLAMAMAEAQEATARVAARQAEEANFCAHCGSALEQPMRCSQCLEVCYCSRECQRQDWKIHKRKCGRKGDSAVATSSASRQPTSRATAAAASAAREPEEDAPDLQEQEEEAERLRQQEERERLEEQRMQRLEEERKRAEEARQEKARLERARNATLRQQKMEEARRKAEKQRQEREAQKAREEEEARQFREQGERMAREAEEAARRKVEMAAYEDYLLAQLKRQELLEAHEFPGSQQGRAVPAPAPAPAPAPVPAPVVAKEPEPAPALQTRFAAANAYSLYKRHQPSMGQRLASLGMDELRGF